MNPLINQDFVRETLFKASWLITFWKFSDELDFEENELFWSNKLKSLRVAAEHRSSSNCNSKLLNSRAILKTFKPFSVDSNILQNP